MGCERNKHMYKDPVRKCPMCNGKGAYVTSDQVEHAEVIRCSCSLKTTKSFNSFLGTLKNMSAKKIQHKISESSFFDNNAHVVFLKERELGA